MMIVSLFKTIAESEGWRFMIATQDVQNLIGECENIDDDTIRFMMEPVEENPSHDEFGRVTEREFIGSFIMVVGADLDSGTSEDGGVDYYDEKRTNHILPVKAAMEAAVTPALSCNEWTIVSWSILEVINLFDTGVDGISVSYRIKRDE